MNLAKAFYPRVLENSIPQRAEPMGRLVEDERLLREQGRFSDDLREPNTLFAYFVRSPHAFAKLSGLMLARRMQWGRPGCPCRNSMQLARDAESDDTQRPAVAGITI